MTAPAVTKAYLASIFPEFAGQDEAVVTALNAPAGFYVSDGFGDQAQYAKALVIAHLLKLNELAGGGPVTSERVGALATTQASLDTKNAWMMTSYGMLYRQLARAKGLGLPMFVNPGGQERLQAFGDGSFAPGWPSDENPQA